MSNLRIRFDPANWYWLATDGRLFSSASGTLVQPDDTTYVAWLAAGFTPTPWPQDTNNVQSAAALQDTIAPYGLFANLSYYAASARFNRETGGFTVGGNLFPTDRDTQSKLTAAVVLAHVNPSATFTWKLADGTFTPPLTASQLISSASAIGAFVNALFAAEDTINQGITSGTITTRAQIDAAIAAVT